MKETTLAAPLIALTFVICWTEGNFECVPHSDSSDYRELLISQFKRKILKRLGYSSPPNVTALPIDQLRKEMSRQFIVNQGVSPIDKAQVPVKTHIYRSQSDIGQNISVHFPNVLPLHTSTFHVDDASTDQLIQKAWLRFCNKVPNGFEKVERRSRKGRLQVYLIENENDLHKTRRHLVYSRPIKSLSSACMHLDVTNSLQGTFTGNVTFVIVLLSGSKTTKHTTPDRKSVMSNIQSTLLVNLAERGQNVLREKREVGRTDCSPKDGEKKCCRYHTYISFKEIAWDDWVIAPDGYDAYYCAGECPHRYKMAHTFAGIKSLLHLINPSRVPPPTCTATRLRPLTLLHLDDTGQMTYSDYPDMIVDECKCS